MTLLIEGFFFLKKKIFEAFGKMVKYWKWPQNRSLNDLSFDWVSDHVQSLAHCKCLPGVASFSSREQIQGSQTSIMWGLNHLSPNKSTYRLIPQPSLGVIYSCEQPKHLSSCTGGSQKQTHGNWVRDSAKPDRASPRGSHPSAGSGGFSTRFSGENKNFKSQTSSPWFINPKRPLCALDEGWLWGATSTSEEGRMSDVGRDEARALCRSLTLCFSGVSVGDRWWCCPGEFVTFSMTCNMSASWQWEERLQLSLQ